MSAPLLDNRVITINDPTSLPLSFLGLEVIVLGLAVLTFLHARAAARRGDRSAMLTWATIVVYGLVMEFGSYNFVDNFAHGQFTVMFYDHQLPLYVTAVYPVMLYIGICTARTLGLPPAREALAAGVLIVAMDFPFDMVGPRAGWWRWFDTDPNIAHRWSGVPVTSYYWHFAFGGLLAYFTAAAARRRLPASPLVVGVLSLMTIFFGVLAFMPMHGLGALGLSHGIYVGAALLVAAGLAITAARTGARRRDPLLRAAWLTFYGFHGVVAVGLATLA